MLGFILSKMNLLILVTAIFAIVGYFTLGLSDIAIVNESAELVGRLREKAFALTSSPNYCFSDRYTLQDDLRVAGSTFYYVLKISKAQVQTDESDEPVNILIFSIYPREEIKKFYSDSDYVPKAIAAESFRTKSELHLYSKQYNGTTYNDPVIETDEFYADPQAIRKGNGLEFIKEIHEGEAKFYVLLCEVGVCEAQKTEIGLQVHPGDEEGGFRC